MFIYGSTFAHIEFPKFLKLYYLNTFLYLDLTRRKNFGKFSRCSY